MSFNKVAVGSIQHPLTPDSPPEDPARSSEVVWSTRGIGVHSLAQESQVLHYY